MASETKKELTSYYISLTSSMTPRQYLESNEGATINNNSIIFFVRDGSDIDISKRVADIWVKDDNGDIHLIAGYSRFYHLADDDYAEMELATGDKAGLMSPEMVKNINAIIAMTDLEGQESRFDKLEEAVNENTKSIKELAKQLSDLNKNINSIVASAMESNKEAFVSQIKGELKGEITSLLEEFINHTHTKSE